MAYSPMVMQSSNSISVLDAVKGSEVESVTFVSDYLQFHFNGPYINAYVWPDIRFPDKVISPNDVGYHDALIGRVGKILTVAKEETDKISFYFSDKAILEISLKRIEGRGEEAVMVQDGTGMNWNVWRFVD